MGGKPLASNLTWQKGSTPSNEFYELSSPEAESTPRHQSLTKNLNANLEEAKKARARMDDIQSRQTYVGFLPDELMSAMSAGAADFFRKGGEELDLSTDWHGVKEALEAEAPVCYVARGGAPMKRRRKPRSPHESRSKRNRADKRPRGLGSSGS